MDTEIVFRVGSAVLALGALAVSIAFRWRADRESGTVEAEGRGKVLLVVMRGLGLLALGLMVAYWLVPGRVGWARWTLPEGLRWAGLALMAAMIPLLWWMFSALGRNITPTERTREDHQLVTHGPYRWIRHPLYTFGILLWTGFVLATALWPVAVLVGIAWILLLVRTPMEERELLERFGDEYRDYMERTGRYLPRLRSPSGS